MRANVQTLQIGRREYVLLPAGEYRRLIRQAGEGTDAPKEPRDAVDFARVSIGRDLARKREKSGLSQTDVATRAGIRAETLSRIETGRGNPTVATVKKILRALGEADSG